MLAQIKALIGIEGDNLDNVLEILVQNACNRILAYLPSSVKVIPEELEWVAVEIAVARYNRIGNEGMDSYGQDGQSISYSSDDLTPYIGVIQAWRERHAENKKGVIRFL